MDKNETESSSGEFCLKRKHTDEWSDKDWNLIKLGKGADGVVVRKSVSKLW